MILATCGNMSPQWRKLLSVCVCVHLTLLLAAVNPVFSSSPSLHPLLSLSFQLHKFAAGCLDGEGKGHERSVPWDY